MGGRERLNREQRRAVRVVRGPVMIVAGPGTGKTKVLVEKINYLVETEKVRPERILALTFTRKAAEEIKKRLRGLLGRRRVLPGVYTFHGLGHELLKQRDEEVLVIDETRRKKLIKSLIEKEAFGQERRLGVREWGFLISGWKTGMREGEELERLASEYDGALEKLGLVDFDDLLVKNLQRLRQEEKFREQLKGRFEYVLVDEFQDTSELEYELLRQIMNPERNVCVIGDPRQSIYAFRGAQTRVFEKFDRDFEGSKKIKLKINYRSGESILRAAQRLFVEDERLESGGGKGGEVRLIKTGDEELEANWILGFINKKVGGVDLLTAGEVWGGEDTRVRFSDFAVVYRIHGLSRRLRRKFFESGIPFQMVGSESLFEQREILMLVACLNYLVDQSEEREEEVVETGAGEVREWLRGIEADRFKLSELVEKLIEKLGLRGRLEGDREKLNGLNEFCGIGLKFDRYRNEEGLEKFGEYWESLVENDYYDERADKVTLMTMHAAKGLEFKYVFVCGFEEGLIPCLKKREGEDKQEEERRLLYVAMTRAKQGLFLLTVKERGRKKERQVSRFSKEIKGEGLIEEEDEAMERMIKRRQREKLKRSQMGLFG